ncbi:MAG: O-antigen ligase family protein [Elusimicrobiota bacterium]|jgi:O-antigen ligase
MLDKIVGIGLILLAIALPFSIALSSLIFFPLLALWLFGGRWTLGRWRPVWGNTEKAYAVFLGISVLSSLLGLSQAHSFHEIYKKDFYFLILVMVAAMAMQQNVAERLVRWLLVAGFLSCVWGLTQFLVGVDQTDNSAGYLIYVPQEMSHWPRPIIDQFSMINGRVAGTYSHPLTYAESLLFLLAFALSFVSFEEGRRWLKWIPLTWLAGAALLVSQSRGPWIAAVCVGLLLIVVRYRWGNLLRFAILILPLSSLFLMPSLRYRVHSIADIAHRSNQERLHMWQAGWQLWKGHPLLGIGPGNVKRVSVDFQNEEEKKEGPWGHLHSTYVNFATERGLFGLAAYGAFIAMLLYELVLGIQRSAGKDRAILWGCVGGILGFLVSGLTETTYNASIISMMFYFVMGIGLALARRKESSCR